MTLSRVLDADTQEFRLPLSDRVIVSRNIDVWAPELRSEDHIEAETAKLAKEWVHGQLSGRDNIRLFIPLPKGKNPFSILTFNRVLSYVFIGDICLNREIVKKGFASSEKGGPLGR